MAVNKKERRRRIHWRIRKKVSGTDAVPRVSVFRSNKHFYLQVIDDVTGTTLTSASSKELTADPVNKTEQAKEVGNLLAQRLKEKNISQTSFDRSGYLYHGRVAAAAQALREGGIQL